MSFEGYIIFSIIGLILINKYLSNLDKQSPLKINKEYPLFLQKIGFGIHDRVTVFQNIIAILVVLSVVVFMINGVLSDSGDNDYYDYYQEDYPVNARDR